MNVFVQKDDLLVGPVYVLFEVCVAVDEVKHAEETGYNY